MKAQNAPLTEHCPNCKVDLRGAEIPAESRHYYAPTSTHFLRWIGLYSVDTDRVTHYRCPECRHLVDRT